MYAVSDSFYVVSECQNEQKSHAKADIRATGLVAPLILIDFHVVARSDTMKPSKK